MTNQKQLLIEKIMEKCLESYGDGKFFIDRFDLEKILQDTLPNEQVVEKKDRYYLVGPDGWIFSSDKKEECIDFKNNMLQSKRFAVGKIKSLIIVDIQDLGKRS